jgi:2-polyprenyl-6-methoxyphenol hydroxylase-like FAD-dependent oxidoreductase
MTAEVLVVGAGPSGLMTAALLLRQGVPVRVIDANAGPSAESRTFAVQARTIELFRSLGLADELLSHGVIDTGVKFHIRGRYVGGHAGGDARAA